MYVATPLPGQPPKSRAFRTPRSFPTVTLSVRKRNRHSSYSATAHPSHPRVRIVDPDISIECPRARSARSGCTATMSPPAIGISRGDASTRSAPPLVNPSPAHPDGPWLRTGDLGFISDDELFIVGRIKDLLIVYGRNHSPDDIEATSRRSPKAGRARSRYPLTSTEQLVAIIELKKRAYEQALQAPSSRDVPGDIHLHGYRRDLVFPAVRFPPRRAKIRRSTCSSTIEVSCSHG